MVAIVFEQIYARHQRFTYIFSYKSPNHHVERQILLLFLINILVKYTDGKMYRIIDVHFSKFSQIESTVQLKKKKNVATIQGDPSFFQSLSFPPGLQVLLFFVVKIIENRDIACLNNLLQIRYLGKTVVSTRSFFSIVPYCF